MQARDERPLLVVDTCGNVGSVALALGSRIVAERRLEERAASSSLLGAIRTVLAEAQMDLLTLGGIGVVAGPGSFTGVRVGLATAKGLCVATGIPMHAISRLEVLLSVSGLERGFAVLRAGPGQVYVREAGGTSPEAEWMAEAGSLPGGSVAVSADEAAGVMASLPEGVEVQVCALSAATALPLVLREAELGGDAVASADANYVRHEQSIYRRRA